MGKKILKVLFFIVILGIYLHNLTRDIYSGDIGDLVTAAYTLGVAHPPGYPLFSFVGFILSHLPIPLPAVSRVGLISVFSSLAGLIIYFNFTLKVTKSIFLSLLSTSILAFSYLFWLTAEIPEGLGLNNFFAIVILYLTVEFYKKKKAKFLFLLALFVGLSLTNQLQIIMLFPAVLIPVLKHWRFIFLEKKIFKVLLFFLLGLSVYVYIPIAASGNPPINWDNAANLRNFLHLVFRQDYGGIINPGPKIPIQIKLINIVHYLRTFVSVFSYQILFLGFLGIVKLFIMDKRLSITFILAFLFTGILTVFYMGSPVSSPTSWGILERYYVLSTVIFMFFIPFGFLLIGDFLKTKFSKPIYSYILLSYFLIIPIMMLQYNFPRTDLSKTKIGNTLARNVLSALPKNSVLFVTGDNTTFSIWYVYYVLKERQDIDIINPPGVGNNLYLDKEINDYFKKNPKIQTKDIIANTFAEIRKKRRVFTNYEIKPMPKNTILVPKGLVFEIMTSQDVTSEEKYLADVEKNWRKIKIQRRETLNPAEQNIIAPEIPFIYSNSLVHIGDFLDSHYHNPQKAESYYRRALWIDDSNPQAYSGLAISLYKSDKNCRQSLENIKQAISIYPVWKNYYIQQYYFAKNCGLDSSVLNKLKQEYKLFFQNDIEKDLL